MGYDLTNSDGDIGFDVQESQPDDVDYGDGDGVNEFDELNNEPWDGEDSSMSFNDDTSPNTEGERGENIDYANPTNNADAELQDFDDLKSQQNLETEPVQRETVTGEEESISPDAQADKILKDFDDGNESGDAETGSEEGFSADAEPEQNEALNEDGTLDDSEAEDAETVSEEETPEDAEADDTETEKQGETAEGADAEPEQNEALNEDGTLEDSEAEDTETVSEEETPEDAELVGAEKLNNKDEPTKDEVGKEGGSPVDSEDVSRAENPKREEINDIAEGVKDITSHYFDEAKTTAEQSPGLGRYFTDHGVEHVEMVMEKSVEFANAYIDSVSKGGYSETKDGNVKYGKIDFDTLKGASLSHDIGMSRADYALREEGDDSFQIYKPDNQSGDTYFDEVRKNHSFNSGLNVLINRDAYCNLGYSDYQVDKMAMECAAHSQTSSHVYDLGSKSDWEKCFDKMDAFVDAYNRDHPDAKISFDRSLFEKDDEALGSLAAETHALRNGDAARDSHDGAKSQSGENVYVDRQTINNNGKRFAEEVNGAKIIIGESKEPIPEDKGDSRRIHAGEQNIVGHSFYANDDGRITHKVTVADGTSAPYCTQESIKDNIKELLSGKAGKYELKVEFINPCDEDAKEKYNDFRRSRITTEDMNGDEKNDKLIISFPWDRRK